jgi:DNA helicase HerA-like ATPase
METGILIGGCENGKVFLNPRYANRHGLIAGATGTGKTVTLQCLAEGFSDIGVPVFMADVKGDLSGLCQAGKPHPKVDERVEKIQIESFVQRGYPVAFWDVFGEQGTPVRSTISEMGPQLLSQLLDLNETQESILTLIFDFADNEGLLLVDINDLRTTLEFIASHGKEISTRLTVSRASVNAILRRLLMLEREGGDLFFGEPALLLEDLMQLHSDGRGMINVLAADKLILSPRVYSTFLLWLLSELFENLPEVGDADKPKMVFFFDEAHLLFNNSSKVLIEKVEQVVRLIRSKGVGVYFITQSPGDLPENVLGQLGNRVQHALRAFTPKDQKSVRVAAQTFRANPNMDTAEVITNMGVGEALVSVLLKDGVPSVVERTLIRPPSSRMGPATDQERQAVIDSSRLHRRYAEAYDPRSAHEILLERTAARLKTAEDEEARAAQEKQDAKNNRRSTSQGSNRQSVTETLLKSVVRSIGSSLGRSVGKSLLRGILGSLMK